ncbi:MAG: ferrous iron transporter B, partial [Elusimicrobia bacterium]|nr:ferrous iron transporter B [Elusimicrobiota bacterium]
GYLPRAGAMVDRALRPFGLDGKVFIPFLSSFACAIPGVMAARTIPNEKRRLTAVLLCPLMTCSARLPVYALIIAAFVSPAFRPLGLDGRAVVMGGLYVFGVLTALLIALALRWTSLYEAQPMPVTVLPPYRLPKPSELARYVWTRCWHFISRAGRVIFMLSLLLWALGSFPRAPKGSAPSVQIEQSLLGRAGRLVEPVFRPIGYDWKISVGVLSSLAAREVFVGTMGSLTAMSGRAATTEELARTLQRDYGLPTAVSLLLFFAVALQCVSTIAIVRRETGGWKWPAIQFSALFVIAYALSFAAVHLFAGV